MSTPVARSPLNAFQGASPDDLNQLLGTHAPVVVYAPTAGAGGVAAPLIGPTTGCAFSQWFPLADAAGSYAIDQTITMSGTVLDRVVLPVSIASGLGNDLLVGLYTDNATNPAGPPLAATLVPKEFLQPSPCPDFNGVMLSPWSTANVNLPSPDVNALTIGWATDGRYIVRVGGTTKLGGTDTNQVFTASVNPSTGDVGPWIAQTPFPVAAHGVGVLNTGTCIIAAGGNSGATTYNTVYVASIDGNGVVGAWTASTALPQTLFWPSLTLIGGSTLVCVGGVNGTSQKTVYTATFANNTVGAWSTPAASQFPLIVDRVALVQVNGWLVALGGQVWGVGTYSNVWATPINATTNTIGSWRPWPSLPAVDNTVCAWVCDNNIVAFSPRNSCSLAVNAGGPATAWVLQPAVPASAGSSGDDAAQLVNNQPSTFVILPGSNGNGGAQAMVTSVPTISVPLHATGLTNNGVYHITVQTTDAYGQVNVTQFALSSTKPATAFSNVAEEGDINSGMVVHPISTDLLSGIDWNTNSVNCTVSTPTKFTLTNYTFQSQSNGGAYSFSTPIAGIAVSAGTVVDYELLNAFPLTGGEYATTSILNFYTSAGVFISSSPGASSPNFSSLSESSITAPATTAYVTLAITVGGGAVGDIVNWSVISFTSEATSYVPMSLYLSGATLKPLHVLDDIVNNQPASWSTIAYDYAGKPVQYGESMLPLVNLLSPNTSNFGGYPTGGTTAGWTPFNCALTLPGSLILPLPLSIANSSASAVGAPAFPSPNPLLQATYMALTSTASGDMGALTASGTSGIPVTVGQHYTASAYFLSGGSLRNYSVTINWYTAAGAACAHASDVGSAISATGHWVQPYVNAVAPATAAFAAVVVVVSATGAASEVHYVNLISLALDNSLQSGLSTPNLAYFDPQSGPGGTRTFLQLEYDPATSQLTNITDISSTIPAIFGTGTAGDGVTVTATYTASGMTDTVAQWPMNGLVGQVIAAPADIINASNAATTTATVAFNTGTTIVLTAAGWSNGQPVDGSAYSIT